MKRKIIGFVLTPIIFLIIITVVLGGLIGSIVAVLSGGEEEENKQGTIVYEESPLSSSVEALRDDVQNELKKYEKEEYINLFLAVIMQESSGEGEDVFQCSESLGKEPNSINRTESITHGVKVLCGYLDHDKVKVSSPQDIEHIKIALQAYNYGGGYITYINDSSGFGRGTTKEQIENLGKWTQANALAYQKKMSAGGTYGYPVARTGSAATILGPYAYGDAYYTKHVLRYYSSGTSETDSLGSLATVGEAAKVVYADKQRFLFPNGAAPLTPDAMKIYLKTITVPIYDGNTNTTMNITVHIKLAEEFKAVFEEMAKAKFPIKASESCAYVWKNIIGTGTVSWHSYGAAIDINWSDNPCFYNTNVDVSKGYLGYQPGKNKYSVTQKIIKIWEAHGFYWGGYWSGKKDTMHFSYTEKPG